MTALCYTDILPPYAADDLQNPRLPYLQPCFASPGDPCDEYPPLTMYAMGLASLVATGTGRSSTRTRSCSRSRRSRRRSPCTRCSEARLVLRPRPDTPPVWVYNWDLLAVALATAGMLAFVRRRDAPSGVLLGLGTAAKLYPGLLVLPLVQERLRDGASDRGLRVSSGVAVFASELLWFGAGSGAGDSLTIAFTLAVLGRPSS